jgi:hypothetical protein
VRLGVTALTLAWTHSVQKTRCEDDWQLQSGALVLVESRIESTGAGMEPGPGARFDGHWWRWRPDLPAQARVQLRRSGATADWSLCIAGTCRLMSVLVPADADPVTLTHCP